ncbi:MAG: cupin domain-containing protein [Planctomycetes bacterium]|jgi:quercetin dioxygenase-like cupin family protein|nr:cupin domain-containing protein [Planctomycetota bacterium]
MKIQRADDITANDVNIDGAEKVRMRMLVGPDDEAPTFYMRQFVVEPSGHTPRHEHGWEHECYILAGSGVVLTPDGAKPIGPGDCLLVPPNEEHQFRNTGDQPLTFLCLVPKTD